MKRFARFVVDRPLWVLALVLAATAFAFCGILDPRSGEFRIRVDPAIDRLLPDADEERLFYDRAQELFGSDEFVLLLVEADDVFEGDVLRRLQRITEKLEQMEHVDRVLSLANAVHASGRDGEVFVGPFFEDPPSDAAGREALRRQVLDHPLYGGSLVSADARATAVLVFVEGISDRDFVRTRLSDRIADAAREEAGNLPILVTGTPHVKASLSRTIVGELAFILPAVLVISGILCAIAFRTVRGVVLPLVAIGIALVWTLGAMGWTGSTLNLVSNIVPPLIITLGFAAAMHVVSEYYELRAHHPVSDRESNRALVRRVLEEMGLAIAVNGFTTVLGFLSLCVSTVLAIREFGTWAVVGVVASTIISLTFIPALFVLLGPGRTAARATDGGRVDRLADAIGSFAVRNRRGILAAGLAVLGLAMIGMARIEISTGFVSNFMSRSQVRTSFEVANHRLGGISSFFVVIESDEDDAFTRPDNLRELASLQAWLEEQPEVGGTASLADGVMLLNQAFADGAPEALAIPERQALVKQLLLFGGDDVTSGFADSSFRAANITVRSLVNESADVKRLMQRLKARLEELPQRLRARPTGDLVLLNRTMDDIARGQLESILSALVTIYLTLALLLTSWRVGLYALLPNLLPIAVYYGTLGITGTPLNLSTSLIGAITLGIAVDDTVHYFTRFALEARRLGDERRATMATLRLLIRPVTFTTIGLVLGFLTLTTSELRNQVEFGVLSAFTLAVAWVLELTLSPALCSSVRLVTLWDLLSLDLGPEPHRSIPLLQGLSERQARIFALMSRIVSVPAGQRLFAEGQKGDEMFVVVDGELAASVERDRKRVELSRMRRGDVVGEIALFADSRSADVHVMTDARLLRFGLVDLDRLGRRYPRIATKVYRNLNRVLAGRVVSSMRALR